MLPGSGWLWVPAGHWLQSGPDSVPALTSPLATLPHSTARNLEVGGTWTPRADPRGEIVSCGGTGNGQSAVRRRRNVSQEQKKNRESYFFRFLFFHKPKAKRWNNFRDRELIGILLSPVSKRTVQSLPPKPFLSYCSIFASTSSYTGALQISEIVVAFFFKKNCRRWWFSVNVT